MDWLPLAVDVSAMTNHPPPSVATVLRSEPLAEKIADSIHATYMVIVCLDGYMVLLSYLR